MAIVARGLGQPEDGSLVAGGLGLSVTVFDPNAMTALLTGSGSLTGTLTDGATPATRNRGSNVVGQQRYIARRPRIDIDIRLELPTLRAHIAATWVDDDEALMMLA